MPKRAGPQPKQADTQPKKAENKKNPPKEDPKLPKQQWTSKESDPGTRAIVAVECANSGKNSRLYQEVKTNEHGKFSVHLPFLVNKHVNHIIDGCLVRLINSGEPHCAVASTTSASSSFRLHSRKKGTHIFSAGFFNLLCNQKPSIHSTTKEALYPHKSLTSSTPNDHTFSPPMSSFLTPKQEFLPPFPRLPPLPELPPLPPLPTLPLLPPIFHSPPMSPPSIFPPNFQSPPMSSPSIFPPFFRSPPIFPPILPPPVIGLTPPPILRLTPLPPPPPPPPTFPFPLFLPFPFRPIPGFPGVPPAFTSKNSP
ncbi:hypothetical protein RND71_021335 [Anisodus tanguticus]|uniref:Uncharacterized protein n=1 Tax=Anisodus tanguticus TaxID=243964 RepID=A0AAE1RY66_9SOLA|nr:hypothetical protein RND71_021335 [Anisodus tanguticus]